MFKDCFTGSTKRGVNHGFTLVEIVVALSIAGILSAMAGTMVLKNMPNRRLAREARNLYSNMQQGKIEAVKRKSCVSFLFTVGGPGVGGYSVFLDNGAGAGGVPCNRIQDGTEQGIIPPVVMDRNVALVSENVTGSGFTFSPLGLVAGAQSGNVVLAASTNGVLGRRYRVTLQAAGGMELESSHDNGVTWED